MRYGLSLLVCFVLCAGANAQRTSCASSSPVNTSCGNQGTSCGSRESRVTNQSAAKQVGPIRQFVRKLFHR